MGIGEKIKLLRKEKNWSQDELAEKIGSNGRHISNYENGKFVPAPKVIIKLAEAFNVSTDYLLLDQAEKKPLTNKIDPELLQLLSETDDLPEEDRQALATFLKAIIAKEKLKKLAITVK